MLPAINQVLWEEGSTCRHINKLLELASAFSEAALGISPTGVSPACTMLCVLIRGLVLLLLVPAGVCAPV